MRIGYLDRKQYTGSETENGREMNGTVRGPRAPGMKYKHYAPKAKVFLFEAGMGQEVVAKKIAEECSNWPGLRIGIVRTRGWDAFVGVECEQHPDLLHEQGGELHLQVARTGTQNGDQSINTQLFSISLGRDVQQVARGLFSALRRLDELACDIIMIEGIPDTEGDLAAAVMNRLRKAAEVDVR